MSELARPAVVLVRPGIPQNVGAIARLCAAAKADLHIVRPIPFVLNDRSLERAGMDYLELLTIHVHNDWESCRSALGARQLWAIETPAERTIYDVKLGAEDALIFGSESHGLPAELRDELRDRTLVIPMREPKARSLNLATSVAIALWEALRV